MDLNSKVVPMKPGILFALFTAYLVFGHHKLSCPSLFPHSLSAVHDSYCRLPFCFCYQYVDFALIDIKICLPPTKQVHQFVWVSLKLSMFIFICRFISQLCIFSTFCDLEMQPIISINNINEKENWPQDWSLWYSTCYV